MAEENFYLSQLNVAVDSTLATMAGADTTSFDGNATAEVTIPVNVAQALFQFSSDSTDITNVDAADILYKFVYETNVAPLGLDIDASAIIIDRAIHPGAADNNLTYDWTRYLAQQLFNTHLGVDLFSNEEEIRTDLNDAFKTELDVVLLALNDAGVSDSTGTSPSKSILDQLIKNKPARFNELDTYSAGPADAEGRPWFKMPLVPGDIIYFLLSVSPAATQEDLTDLSEAIAPRDYLIKAVMGAPSV